MAKATAKKKESGKRNRWTEEEVHDLMQAVKAHKKQKDAFQEISDKTGRSVGTIQQKYYLLKKKGSGAKRGRPKGNASKALRNAPVASKSNKSAPSVSPAYLSGLNSDELVNIAKLVKAEVDRRRKDLDTAVALFKS